MDNYYFDYNTYHHKTQSLVDKVRLDIRCKYNKKGKIETWKFLSRSASDVTFIPLYFFAPLPPFEP